MIFTLALLLIQSADASTVTSSFYQRCELLFGGVATITQHHEFDVKIERTRGERFWGSPNTFESHRMNFIALDRPKSAQAEKIYAVKRLFTDGDGDTGTTFFATQDSSVVKSVQDQILSVREFTIQRIGGENQNRFSISAGSAQQGLGNEQQEFIDADSLLYLHHIHAKEDYVVFVGIKRDPPEGQSMVPYSERVYRYEVLIYQNGFQKVQIGKSYAPKEGWYRIDEFDQPKFFMTDDEVRIGLNSKIGWIDPYNVIETLSIRPRK